MTDERVIAVLKHLCGETIDCRYCTEHGRDMSCNACHQEALRIATDAMEERGRMIGWLSKFCLHIDMADKHLSDEEAKVFWKKKMNEQFGWEEGEV